MEINSNLLSRNVCFMGATKKQAALLSMNLLVVSIGISLGMVYALVPT